jgi:hypothetical protein
VYLLDKNNHYHFYQINMKQYRLECNHKLNAKATWQVFDPLMLNIADSTKLDQFLKIKAQREANNSDYEYRIVEIETLTKETILDDGIRYGIQFNYSESGWQMSKNHEDLYKNINDCIEAMHTITIDSRAFYRIVKIVPIYK